MHSPRLRSGELHCPSLREEHLCRLYGILLCGKFVLLHSLFIHSISPSLICINRTHDCFILWVIVQYYFTYFVAQVFHHWEFFHLALVSFWHSSIIVCVGVAGRGMDEQFFTFWQCKILQTHFVYFLSQSCNQSFLKNGERKQDPALDCCYWGVIASRPSQLREKRNAWVHANSFICVSKTTYI